MKIAVRKGHTILRNGTCTSAQGIVSEYKEVRKIGELVIKYLKILGHSVIDVTPTDRALQTKEDDVRYGVSLANQQKADLFLSIHLNAFNGQARGTEVLVYPGVKKDRAASILSELVKLGYTTRGVKERDDLHELKATKMEAALVECFFCDNEDDVKIYNPDKIARAIVKGVTGKTVAKHKPVTAKNVYTVKSGDTLSEIAFENKTTIEALQKLNNIKNANEIKAGQKIKLPETPKKVKKPMSYIHVVKAGDTLSELAVKYKTTVDKLKKINKLKSDLIKVGQKIRYK
jgi:N-acetylmuramoyl-L-alanine amidase